MAASGPSFTPEQAEQVEGARAAGLVRVLAINATVFTLPNVDAMFASDRVFWIAHGARVLQEFRGQIWTADKLSADEFGLRYVPRVRHVEGLSRDFGAVSGGGNSGYAGVNLAYLFGARELLALVGFDMCLTNGRTHHHGDHTGRLANPTANALAVWAGRFPALARDLKAAGVNVVNCTVNTALTCFPRASLEDALAL
ncbi:MAG: hypothetical protein ABI624_19460 [Casimicrobiaceae bacterium]